MIIDLYNREREIEALTREREALAQEKLEKAVEEVRRKAAIEVNRELLQKLVDKGKLSQKEAENAAREEGFSLYSEF